MIPNKAPARARIPSASASAFVFGAAALAFACLPAAASPIVSDPVPDPASPPLEVVKFGVFTLAPYVMSGPDGPTGALVEFFDKEIAPRMGVRFDWQRPMTTARLQSSLASGAVTFAPILAKTPARLRARLRFAGEAYVRLDPCIAVLPDSPLIRIDSPADLAGVSVGWVQAGALPAFMLDRRIRLDRIGTVEWTAANLEKLRFGRIGAAYFSNPYTPQYVAGQAGMKVRLISLPVKGPLLYGTFAPRTPKALVERYRKAAAEAFADDRFSQYLHRALVEEVLSRPPGEGGKRDGGAR